MLNNGPNTNMDQMSINHPQDDPFYQWRFPHEGSFVHASVENLTDTPPYAHNQCRDLKRRRNDALEEMSPENRDIIEQLRQPNSCRRDRLCRLTVDSQEAPSSVTKSPFTLSNADALTTGGNADVPTRFADQSDMNRLRRYIAGRLLQQNPQRPRLPVAPPEREGFMGTSRPGALRRYHRSTRNVELRSSRFRQAREDRRYLAFSSQRANLLDEHPYLGLAPALHARAMDRFDLNRPIRERSVLRSAKRRRRNVSDEDNLPSTSRLPAISMGYDVPSTSTASTAFQDVGVDVVGQPGSAKRRRRSSDSDGEENCAMQCAQDADHDGGAPTTYEDMCRFYVDVLECKKVKLDDDEAMVAVEANALVSSPSRRNVNKFSLETNAGTVNILTVKGGTTNFAWETLFQGP